LPADGRHPNGFFQWKGFGREIKDKAHSMTFKWTGGVEFAVLQCRTGGRLYHKIRPKNQKGTPRPVTGQIGGKKPEKGDRRLAVVAFNSRTVGSKNHQGL